MTYWKTSHGPEKSITTAPSEIRKATGILPWAGGLMDFASVEPELAERSPTAENAIAAIKPNSMAILSNPLPHIMFVFLFMASSFLCQPVGSNDNNHHI